MQSGKFHLNFEQIYLDAQSSSLEEKIEDELFSFAALIRGSYEFKLFMEDPRVSPDYKKEVLKKLSPPGISNIFLSVIHTLIDNGREELIEELSRDFTKRMFREKGILFGQVSSVVPVPEKLRLRLKSVLEKTKKCPVRLRFETDPELLGGLSVRLINGEVWDVSLKHKLDDLKAAIAQ